MEESGQMFDHDVGGVETDLATQPIANHTRFLEGFILVEGIGEDVV